LLDHHPSDPSIGHRQQHKQADDACFFIHTKVVQREFFGKSVSTIFHHG
jgi:hypothetical protein